MQQKKRGHKRFRKDQIAILEREFQMNSDWDREFQKELGDRLGFPQVKIYKWHYDRKMKARLGVNSSKV